MRVEAARPAGAPGTGVLAGNSSLAKAFTATPAITMVQAAKNMKPALKTNESLVMRMLQWREVASSLAPGKGNARRSRASLRKLLLGRGWRNVLRVLLHVLLHASLMVCLHLFQLRLLIGSEQLIHLVVNARVRYGEFSLDLGFLVG